MGVPVGDHDYNHTVRRRQNVRGRSETCLTPRIPRVPYIIPEIARAAF